MNLEPADESGLGLVDQRRREGEDGDRPAGLIAVVRAALSFFLAIELTGVLPWRRGSAARGRSDLSTKRPRAVPPATPKW